VIAYIEKEPWDEELLRQEKFLKAACWVAVAFAAAYFGGMILAILTR